MQHSAKEVVDRLAEQGRLNNGWLNGEAVADLPATDRGLHYGDGLFETIRVDNKQPIWWQQHLERLLLGCERLGITIEPGIVEQELQGFIVKQKDHGIVKLMITRGSGGRGYSPSGANQPTRLLLWYPLPNYPAKNFQQGIQLFDCQSLLGHQPLLAGLKHLNRLEQVLARQEWNDNQFAEGLMLDLNQHIVEGTMTNVFWVADNGELHTPNLNDCGVAGVCRQFVLQQAQQLGITTKQECYTVADLAKAKEVFVCNSVIGVWPVRAYRQWSWPLGSLTQQLQALINAVMPCERLFSKQ
ncbi:aminodeoxychorismate lyase [Spartinivicinus sp. A2-2]|uniref:Aminodeoxychorismate lyase n=1 Tax=Spartinivicinus poritis TaxID=2994640 RepID=A0ABT5U8W6_9GAMM|nr:aminodeoxychorismate lyase [Spartinivicinus sp. A2-2]